MDLRRLHLIVSTILLIFLLAACAQSRPSAPSGTAISTTAVAVNTAVPIKSNPAPTVVAPTQPATTTAVAVNTPVPTKSNPAPTAAAPTQPASATAGGGCANAYYPVPSGATWSYASSGSTSVGNYTYTRTISAASDAGFTSGYQFSTGVNWLEKWTCQDGNLAELGSGAGSASMTTSTAKMTSTSVTADGYNIPATFYSGEAWSEDLTITGTVKSGTKEATSQIASRLNCTAGGAATITVPAGTFDTVMATCTKKVVVSAIVQGKSMQVGANQESITYWYAKGVGFVKSVATGGSDNETIVLTRYKLPS